MKLQQTVKYNATCTNTCSAGNRRICNIWNW